MQGLYTSVLKQYGKELGVGIRNLLKYEGKFDPSVLNYSLDTVSVWQYNKIFIPVAHNVPVVTVRQNSAINIAPIGYW